MERRFGEARGTAPEPIIYAVSRRPLWVDCGGGVRDEREEVDHYRNLASGCRLPAKPLAQNQRSLKGASRGISEESDEIEIVANAALLLICPPHNMRNKLWSFDELFYVTRSAGNLTPFIVLGEQVS